MYGLSERRAVRLVRIRTDVGVSIRSNQEESSL